MKINTQTFAKNYNLLAGSLDGLTGIVLVCNPALVLYFMGLDLPTEGNIFLKYVGVFVLSTGTSYFVPYFYKFFGISFITLSYAVWIISSLTRILVFTFVFVKILQGELLLPWILVGLSDLSIAVFQIYLLRIYRENIYE